MFFLENLVTWWDTHSTCLPPQSDLKKKKKEAQGSNILTSTCATKFPPTSQGKLVATLAQTHGKQAPLTFSCSPLRAGGASRNTGVLPMGECLENL